MLWINGTFLRTFERIVENISKPLKNKICLFWIEENVCRMARKGIPTLALSKSGCGSKHTAYSQPDYTSSPFQYHFYIIFSLSVCQDYCILCRYFSLVAIPPLICLSDLFMFNTFLACVAREGLICSNLSVTSLCTVDLLTPNFLAVCLTVALYSIM